MQLVVQSAGVAHGLAVVVAPPQRRRRRTAVGARDAAPAISILLRKKERGCRLDTAPANFRLRVRPRLGGPALASACLLPFSVAHSLSERRGLGPVNRAPSTFVESRRSVAAPGPGRAACDRRPLTWVIFFWLDLMGGLLTPLMRLYRPQALHRWCPVPSRRHNGVTLAAQFTHSFMSMFIMASARARKRQIKLVDSSPGSR